MIQGKSGDSMTHYGICDLCGKKISCSSEQCDLPDGHVDICNDCLRKLEPILRRFFEILGKDLEECWRLRDG